MLENKFVNFDDNEMHNVAEILKTGKISGTSPLVETYESKLADTFNSKYALAVSSGTAALHLLMYVYDIGVGDEVVVPPSAPVMSVLPIIAVGATPVFVDNQVDSFGYDMDDLKLKVNEKTKMIISVPLWGYATNSKDVSQFSKSLGMPFVEDLSHCHGTIDDGKPTGHYSDVSFFSTQERKLISTGEGGFILTNHDEIANRVREVRDFGKPVASLSPSNHLYEYGHLFGLNFRITAISAAIGLAQIDKLEPKIEQRTKNASHIKQSLEDKDWLKEIKIEDNSKPNYYSLLYVLAKDIDNLKVGQQLYDKGIVSDSYRFKIRPLYEMPLFASYKSSCPNSEKLLKRIITLPVHEGLSSEDIATIVSAISEIDREIV